MCWVNLRANDDGRLASPIISQCLCNSSCWWGMNRATYGCLACGASLPGPAVVSDVSVQQSSVPLCKALLSRKSTHQTISCTHCAPPLKSQSLPFLLSSFQPTIPDSVGPMKDRDRREVLPRQHTLKSLSAFHTNTVLVPVECRKHRGLSASTNQQTDSKKA